MSTGTNGSWGCPFIGDVRSSKKRKMVADANYNRQSPSEYTLAITNSFAAGPHEQGGSTPHVPIDVDALDDDVLISSPMAFAQARNKSRRNWERAVVNVIDVESEGIALEGMAVEALMNMVAPSFPAKRKRVPPGQTIIDCDLYECLEGPSCMIEGNVQIVQPLSLMPPPSPPLPPPPPPKEPTFSCPICMSSFDEPMTTKCGHIFCKACLKAAIAAQKKCPTCRARITTMRSTFRVYLPTAR